MDSAGRHADIKHRLSTTIQCCALSTAWLSCEDEVFHTVSFLITEAFSTPAYCDARYSS